VSGVRGKTDKGIAGRGIKVWLADVSCSLPRSGWLGDAIAAGFNPRTAIVGVGPSRDATNSLAFHSLARNSPAPNSLARNSLAHHSPARAFLGLEPSDLENLVAMGGIEKLTVTARMPYQNR